MSNVIFARPDYEYDSYKDFHRLIEVSGFLMCKIGEIDPASDNIYIITCANGEIYGGWPDARARIILFDLEWRLDPPATPIPGVNEIWAADAWYAQQIGAKYVPLGSHPDLPTATLDSVPSIYDVAMLTYYTNRRQQMAVWLNEKGIRIAPNGWGMERHNILLQSRAMLHVHQHDGVATVAPQRFALAAAYKMPLISEQVVDKGIFHQSSVLWCDYAHLPKFVSMWKDDAQAKDRGEALHWLLCEEHSFRKEVEAAL